MSNLTAQHHKQTAIVVDVDGMVNASLLAKQYGRNPVEYIMLDGNQPIIARVAEHSGKPLHPQWQDSKVRLRNKPEYLRALTAVSVIRYVAGTPGGHLEAAKGAGGNGIYNYAAGLWVHPALGKGLARWLECRGESWKPSPLAEFVEQVLVGHETTAVELPSNVTPQSAADSFTGMVDAQTLENLRQLDHILIGGGVAFSDRHQTLHARLEQRAKREA
ncbi:hypothetical protein [uncultured Pseudomonas sp.]|uniref:hypothetical protein n=1 Tax=uncultured Pseudomonas sp. TaxID=114707 RepID=UPI0030DB9068|tara:strand:+ start:18034 stop:18687 length:654 start_codon:yes stop_codon:yes gene_type:complete